MKLWQYLQKNNKVNWQKTVKIWPVVIFINNLYAAFLCEAPLFCTNDKKAISQNIFVWNLYKIFAVCHEKLQRIFWRLCAFCHSLFAKVWWNWCQHSGRPLDYQSWDRGFKSGQLLLFSREENDEVKNVKETLRTYSKWQPVACTIKV